MLFKHGRSLLRASKPVRNLSLFYANVTAVEGILWFVFPIYFAAVLNDLKLVGLLIAAHSAASLLIDLPAGDLIDKIGRKHVFIVGIMGLFLSFALLTVGSLIPLLLGMIFYGVFSTFYGNAAYAIVLDKSRKQVVGESAGVFNTLGSLGWTIGPLLAGALMTFMAISSVLVLAVIASAALVYVSFWIAHAQLSDLKKFKPGKIKQMFVEDKIFLGELRRVSEFGYCLVPLLFFSFVFGFWEYTVWMTEPIFTSLEGISPVIGGLILTLFFGPALFFSMPAGALADRRGMRFSIKIGVALVFLGQIPLFLAPSLLFFVTAILLTEIGLCFVNASLARLVKSRAKFSLRGELITVDDSVYGFGGVVAPLLAGALISIESLGSFYAFFKICFVLFVFACALLFFLKDE